MIIIRSYDTSDWPAVWPMIRTVFREGETYAFPPDISEKHAHDAWIKTPAETYVANDDNRIVGSFYIKPNAPGLGAHVCNCGYIVLKNSRGQGVASLMCETSQKLAVAMGFRAMQYNLVVATNTQAIRLWRKHGFHVVGTLPRAFRSKTLGYVDALVMYKELIANECS